MFTVMFLWMAYKTGGDCWGLSAFLFACWELGMIGKYIL